MLELIKSGKLKGKKVAVLYPTFTSGVDLVKANVIDLLKSKGVNVVQAEALTPDPSGDISSQYPLVVGRLKSNGVDTVITSSAGGNTFRFSALTKELRNQGLEKAVTLYSLDAQYDAVIDLSRQVGGVDGAKLINDMNIYGFSAAGQQDWRVGATEGTLVTQCNKDYDAATTLNQDDLPQPAPPAFARDPYGTVGLICAMYRTMARGLYNAGPNLTQKSAIKAFEELPYLDSVAAKGSPPPRPTQIINHVPTKVQYTQTLNKAEYPCAHPSLPPDAANYRICLVPQPGYDKGGKAITRPLLRRQELSLPTSSLNCEPGYPARGRFAPGEQLARCARSSPHRGSRRYGRRRPVLAAFAAEEDGAGEVVAGGELVGGAVEADAALLDEDDAVGDGGGDVERLLHDDHRVALCLESLDDVEQRVHDERREAERELVDEQELRLEQQRAPEREHLLLAAGERRRVLVAARAQGGEHVVDVGDAPFGVAPLGGVGGERGAKVVAHRQAGEHVGAAHLHDALCGNGPRRGGT